MNLLEKTRKLNEVLQNYDEVQIPALAEVLSSIENANVYCADGNGKVLGYKQLPECLDEERLITLGNDKYFSEFYIRYLQNILSTEIVAAKEEGAVKNTLIVPVYKDNKRLATLVLELLRKDVKNDDIIIAEFASTALGAAVMRANALYAEQMKAVRVAMDTLSYSETNAVKSVLGEMDGDECYLVASKIADKVGITRSVIVNALRKLESAGVIETRSLGMKGTFIRVKAPMIMDELNKL